MGEYAEYQMAYEMRRGFKGPGYTGPHPRNPITAECELCGKKTRSLGGDPLAGLRAHMKDKHNLRLSDTPSNPLTD